MGEALSTNTAHTVKKGHQKAIYIYSIFLVALIFGASGLRYADWQGNQTIHTLFELTATLLACFIGVLSIVRFYTRRSHNFFLIGLGFLGAAVLDGYHSIIASLTTLVPWSWNASRVFLSLMLFLSWYARIREERKGELAKINVKRLTILASLLVFLCLILISFLPLPRVYYEEFFMGRPQELIAALFFLLALAGYYKRGSWKTDFFDFWMILSLIAGFVLQAFYMSFSRTLFDPFFDAAHVLKIISYIFVLVGLLISMYHLFRDAEESRKKMAAQNMDLLKMQREVELKTMQLSGQIKDMKRQNQQLEETQKIAFKLVKDIGNAKAEMEREQAKDEALF